VFTKIKNDSCFHYETHIGKNRKEKEKQINTLACHVGWQAQTGGQLLRRCAPRARKLNSARMLFWISDKGLHVYDMEQGSITLHNPGPDVPDSSEPMLLMRTT